MEHEFRKMRRFKQQLTEAECRELLKQEVRGTLAVNGNDGYPYAFPMNFCFNEETGTLYLHGAKAGYKMDALRRNDKVCFCLHDEGFQEEGKWQRHFRSIVIFGRIRLIDDPEDTIEYARKFDRKFESEEDVETHIKREGALVKMLELTIDHMTGKRVIEG